jgi:hypothetical protein
LSAVKKMTTEMPVCMYVCMYVCRVLQRILAEFVTDIFQKFRFHILTTLQLMYEFLTNILKRFDAWLQNKICLSIFLRNQTILSHYRSWVNKNYHSFCTFPLNYRS